MIYCFYEDLAHLRKFLLRTWTMVFDGEMNLITAAIVTNIALELAQKGEDSIISAMPDEPVKDSYSAITFVIHTAPVIISPDSEPNAHESRSFSLEDFIFQSTYFSVLKYKFFIDDCERSQSLYHFSTRIHPVRFIILLYN
jgi:hypothetical protein